MRKIVATAAFLIFGVTSYAQISDGMRLGLSANPFISFLGSNNPEIAGAGSNMGFGLMFNTELYMGSGSIDEKNYAITTGLGISFNNGGKLTHTNGGQLWVSDKLQAPLVVTDTAGVSSPAFLPNGTTLGYKLQAVRLPIGVKMRTNEIGYLRYYGEVPFLFDIFTQARGKVTDANEFNTDRNQTINGDVNFLNISWGIGGGVEYEVSTGTSLVGGLYFHGGILDMTKDNGNEIVPPSTDPTKEASKTVVNSVSLKIGVLF